MSGSSLFVEFCDLFFNKFRHLFFKIFFTEFMGMFAYKIFVPLCFFKFLDGPDQILNGLFIEKDTATLTLVFIIKADDRFQSPAATIGDYRFTETLRLDWNNSKIFSPRENQCFTTGIMSGKLIRGQPIKKFYVFVCLFLLPTYFA